MDGTRDLLGVGGADPASAILERLDSIGRLLAQGMLPPPGSSASSPPETEAHLVNRIDMLGRIVEQALADREEADARLAALTRRLVDLEGRLAPALDACAERLTEAVPLLAEAALDRLPGGGTALRVALRELRDAVASIDRRLVAPGRPVSLAEAVPVPAPALREPHERASPTRLPPLAAPPDPTPNERPGGEEGGGPGVAAFPPAPWPDAPAGLPDEDRPGPLVLVDPLRPAQPSPAEADPAPPQPGADGDIEAALRRLLAGPPVEAGSEQPDRAASEAPQGGPERLAT